MLSTRPSLLVTMCRIPSDFVIAYFFKYFLKWNSSDLNSSVKAEMTEFDLSLKPPYIVQLRIKIRALLRHREGHI